jgi:hypothetical protein
MSVPFPIAAVLELLNTSSLPQLSRLNILILTRNHVEYDTYLVGPRDGDFAAEDRHLALNPHMARQLKVVLLQFSRCRTVRQLGRTKMLLGEAARDDVLRLQAGEGDLNIVD